MNGNLNLVWKDEGGNTFDIGMLLCKKNKYYFQYNETEVKRAGEYGFELLPAFPKLNVMYFKEELFSTFQGWIQGGVRKDENTFELLKNLMEDRFYFIEKEEVS